VVKGLLLFIYVYVKSLEEESNEGKYVNMRTIQVHNSSDELHTRRIDGVFGFSLKA